MKHYHLGAVFTVLLLVLPFSLSAQERTAGALRIELFPRTSSFQLQLRTQEEQEAVPSALRTAEDRQRIPLIDPHDLTSSYFSLLDDGRVYIPAREREFRRRLIQTDDGHLAYSFTSRGLDVQQVFVPHPGRRVAPDSIELRFEIHNTSTRPRSIALRFLVDTHLGEQSGVHTVVELDDASQLIPRHETTIDMERSVAVRSTRNTALPSALGLRIPLTASGAPGPSPSTPEKVVVANWFRLNDSSWDYTTVPGRGFSSPPYSRNDSAVALYYPETVLDPGAVRTISIVFQATPAEVPHARHTVVAPTVPKERSEVLVQLEQRVEELTQDSEESNTADIQNRLRVIDEIIAEMNRRLAEQDGVDDASLQDFEQLLQRLE